MDITLHFEQAMTFGAAHKIIAHAGLPSVVEIQVLVRAFNKFKALGVQNS